MGATTYRIDQFNVSFPLPVTINGLEFYMTCEAQVMFGDPAEGEAMKEADDAYISCIGFGTATLKFHDRPAEMRAAIKAAAITAAYDAIDKMAIEAI